MNKQYLKQATNTMRGILFLFIVIFSCNSAKADNFDKYVGEAFYLPFPKLSLNNAAIYDYNYEPTTHINILNQSYGEAKITSYFTGSEFVTCNIYYYIQSPSGYRQYGRTTQSHRVTCKNNNITLSAPRSEINVNEGMQLSHRFAHSTYDANPQVTYSVASASPHGCVSVSQSGYVKGVSAGSATIQAKSNLSNNVSTLTILVRKIDPTSVDITPSNASVYCDESLRLSASVYPPGASQNVTWSIYDGSSSTASLSSSGYVTGKTPGEIIVKAAAENGVYGLQTVTVKEPAFTRESTIPSNNATRQNVFITPSVTFSHTLYKGENFNNITLKTASGNNIGGSVSMSGRSIVFNPTKPLSANTKYTLTIPANSVKNKWGTNYSSTVSNSFTTGDLEKLTISANPSTKFVKEGTIVSLTCSKTNAAIYYTLDGTSPSENSTHYTSAIVINQDTELKAIAILEGYEDSDVLSNTYIISNVAVLNVFPNDENPLYIYSNAIPSMTFSNRIEASANADKISFQCVGIGELEKDIIVCDSSIYVIPTNPLVLGNVYKISIPANAIKTWQGEYNEASEWSFATGDFVKRLSANSPELGIALKSDNSVLVWGSQYANGSNRDGSYEYNIIKTPTKFMSDVLEVSTGYMHYAAIKSDGSLWMWGRQYCGEFGNNSTTASSQPTKVLTSGVRSVSTGGQTTAIIKDDNSLWMSGRNDFGQIGTGTTDVVKTFIKILDNVKSAVAGWGVSFAVSDNGQLYGWGRNDKNQLLNDTVFYDATPKVIMEDVVIVSASVTESDYFAAIKNNGELIVWGDGIAEPKIVDQDVSSVSVGQNYVEYVKSDGTLWAFGENNYAQLGNGLSEDISIPIRIAEGVSSIQSSSETTFVLKENGSVWSWGRDKNHLLGQATNYSEISVIPTQIIDGMPISDLNGLACNKKQLTIKPDNYAIVPVYPQPLTANYDTIIWESSNTDIFDVDQKGLIYGVSEGDAVLTATIKDGRGNSYIKKCTIYVSNTTDIDDVTDSNKDIIVWASKFNIFVKGATYNETIFVYDINGRLINSTIVKDTVVQIKVPKYGVYLIVYKGNPYKLLCK